MPYKADRRSLCDVAEGSEAVEMTFKNLFSGENGKKILIFGAAAVMLLLLLSTLTGTVQPKVRGAAVVCSGASDPVVREKVANAVAKALNIGISKVYVTD